MCRTAASALNFYLQACIAGRGESALCCVCVSGLSYRWASGSGLARLSSASLEDEQSKRKEE